MGSPVMDSMQTFLMKIETCNSILTYKQTYCDILFQHLELQEGISELTTQNQHRMDEVQDYLQD